jgi:pimeloyl-ACP methyl ester carboxylesterase
MDISIPSYVLAIAAPALLTFSTACGVHTAPFRDGRIQGVPHRRPFHDVRDADRFHAGRHDFQVPAVLAARYFERIGEPARRLVWFEESAHNPPFPEPERFNRAHIEALKSVTVIYERRSCNAIHPYRR